MAANDASAAAPVAPDRYTSVAVALHWVIALLILGQLAGGVYMSNLPESAADVKFATFQAHKSFGITILLLSLLRLGWRLTHKAPPPPADAPRWQTMAAQITHVAFYGLMIGVPLGGWAVVSASPLGDSVPTYLFGVIPWPHLPFFSGVDDREALAGALAGAHGVFAFAIVGLLVLHIGAALKHHFVDRDDVLARMIPFLKSRG